MLVRSRPRQCAIGSFVVLAATMLPCTGSAQLGRVGLRIDVEARVGTGNVAFLGCGFDGADIYVTARAHPAVPGRPHLLYRLDRQGNVLATYDQPGTWGNPSAWGMRDLAFDGRHFYGGDESPVGYAFDTVTKTFDPARNIQKPGVLNVMRALAHDPTTDTFWGSDFGGLACQFKRDGTVLWQGLSGVEFMYGAAYDSARNRLWWFGQAGGSRPNTAVVGIEFDPIAKAPTGTEFIGDLSVPGHSTEPPGGLAGGMEFYNWNGEPTLLCLAQALSDTVYELGGSFVYGSNCAGGSGRMPAIGMAAGASWLGNAGWQVTLADVSGAAHGILHLGTSKTRFRGGPLPLALDGMGLPGCSVLASIDAFAGAAAVTGAFATLSVAIPKDNSLRNASVFWQWIVVDPGVGNPLKLTLSTGGQTILY